MPSRVIPSPPKPTHPSLTVRRCPAAAVNGHLPKPAPKNPAPKPTSQSALKPKLALAEVSVDSPFVTAAPVGPELTANHAASRYVFVPASEFGAEGIGGYVARCALPASARPAHLCCPAHCGRERVALRAVCSPALPCPAMLDALPLHNPLLRCLSRIMQVGRDKLQTTRLNFKDADGKSSSKYFEFEHVSKTFKPLS